MAYLGDCWVGLSGYPYWKGSGGCPLGNDRPSRHILSFLHRKIMDIVFELERLLLMEQCTPPLGDSQVCMSGISG